MRRGVRKMVRASYTISCTKQATHMIAYSELVQTAIALDGLAQSPAQRGKKKLRKTHDSHRNKTGHLFETVD